MNTLTECNGFHLNDTILAYHKGFHRLVEIQRRWELKITNLITVVFS
ncbi:MAG TPA: hypothetical protein P5509_03540 [Bacteroidales bacterium]|nr:hypothetical protein [Bacteroidales bacterium]